MTPPTAHPEPVPLERDFLILNWRRENGVPDDRVSALLPTHDGLLWLGTRKGISRFDGHRFLTWSRSTQTVFTSEECRALVEDRDGVVWAGTWGGGVVRLSEPPQPYDLADLPERSFPLSWPALNQVWSLAMTASGELLVGTTVGLVTRSTKGAWTIEDTRDTAGFGPVTAFVPGADGTTWVGTTGQLYRRDRPGTAWVADLPGGFEQETSCVFGLAFAGDGILHVMAGSRGDGPRRLLRRDPAGWRAVLDRDCNNFSNPLFLIADRDGDLWFPTTGHQIGRWRAGQLTEYTLPPALNGDVFLTMAADHQGNLWAGTTRSGLLCLHPRRVRMLDASNGLPDPQTWALWEASDGALWVGTDGGAVRLRRTQDGWLADATPPVPGKIRALTEDSKSGIWIGTASGLSRWDGRDLRAVEYPGEPYRHKIRVLHTGRDGAVWVGTAQGLYRFTPTETNAWSVADGLPHENVCAVLEDHRGEVWIGTDGGGLARLTATGFERFDESHGLSSLRVWALHEDEQGVLWIGTDRGLNVLRQGRLSVLSTQQGLPDNLVNAITSDGRGKLWVGHDRGIYRMNRREVSEVLEGRRDALRCVAYTEQDGLASLETNGQISSPPVIRLRDGRLAFATMGGVALFDPEALPDLTNGPPALIEEALVGGKRLFSSIPPRDSAPAGPKTALRAAPQITLRIPPHQRGLVEVRYTAVSFRAPGHTQFRYRLIGLTPDWVEAGGLRQATYANLAPGSYTFEVLAANQHGYWSAAPARLALVVEPAWHERSAVRATGAFLAAGILLAVVRWRLRELRRLGQLEQQAALARHRARLAKDLHDSLGADLTQITLLSGMGESASLSPEATKERFDRLSRCTHDALRSLRDLIWTTTPKADRLEALVSRLCETVERATEAAHLRCRFDIPAELPALIIGPELRRDLLLAVSEALHNALRHAQATTITARVRLEQSNLVIELEDDGRGFDPNAAKARPSPPDRGLGLANLHERLRSHGGVADVLARPGRGTTVRFRVPLPPTHPP